MCRFCNSVRAGVIRFLPHKWPVPMVKRLPKPQFAVKREVGKKNDKPAR